MAAVGFAAFTSCGRNKGQGFPGYGLVANAGDNSLAAVDLTTFRLEATLDLGAPPAQVISFAAGASRHAFAVTPATGNVHRVDETLKPPQRRRFADTLRQIALQDGGHTLFAVARQQRQLIQAEAGTLQIQRRYPLSLEPNAVDFSTGYAAAADTTGNLELIHLPTGQRQRTETPPLGEIRFRGDGKILLAANLRDRSLLALHVPSLRLVAELPLPMRPDNLCFSADQGQLFVSGAGMDGVAVVFPFNILQVDQTLLAGRAPGVMACSAIPAYLFVGSGTASDVCILNIATRKPLAFVDFGGHPSFITVTPGSEYALVLDSKAGDMGVIHIPAVRANRLKTGAALYNMISVGAKPVGLAVISRA